MRLFSITVVTFLERSRTDASCFVYDSWFNVDVGSFRESSKADASSKVAEADKLKSPSALNCLTFDVLWERCAS